MAALGALRRTSLISQDAAGHCASRHYKSALFKPVRRTMTITDTEALDRAMMSRAIALSRASGAAGEYPYGVVIVRRGEVVAESINRVTQDGDVTRHAEVVAISAAQKALDTVSLDDCALYVNAEPCAFCSY